MKSHAEYCPANLCCEDPDVRFRTWFPGEPVCTHLGATAHRWNVNQRKINKLHARHPVLGIFTFGMLDGVFRVSAAFRGLDPDNPRATPSDWTARHHHTADQVAAAALRGQDRATHLAEWRARKPT